MSRMPDRRPGGPANLRDLAIGRHGRGEEFRFAPGWVGNRRTVEQLQARCVSPVTCPAHLLGLLHLRVSTLKNYSAPAVDLDGVWDSIETRGYAVTDEESIGLPQKFRENFDQTYFSDQILRHDEGDKPIDRKRARDVIRYWWKDGELDLAEHDAITITNRAGIPGKREHARVNLLNDPQAEELVRAFLRLVPPSRRQGDGTFGVNLFRTYTNVVTTPHHDNEEYIILYVMKRIGDGAETYLYDPADILDDGEAIAEPILRRQLNPGQIIIFEDSRFKHGATPLVPPPGESAMRDALICTVDYADTYLVN
jgi:2OG-Fe dioxygenase